MNKEQTIDFVFSKFLASNNLMLVPLSQGLCALINKEDYNIVKDYNWCAVKSGNAFYAQANIYKNGKRTVVKMHTLLKPNDYEIDHINGCGLDNTNDNIRIVSHTQNMKNHRGKNNSTSSYRGVSWHSRANKWQAQAVDKNKKKVYLGLWKNEILAGLRLDMYNKQEHGDFSYLNFNKDNLECFDLYTALLKLELKIRLIQDLK